MESKHTNILLSAYILYIICYILSCTHYTNVHYKASITDIHNLDNFTNEQGYEYTYSVKELDEPHILPLIYDYPYHSQIIARPTIWLGKGHVIGPQHYSVSLPKGIRFALTNQSCELILLYNNSQAIWIWDDEYRNHEDVKNLNLKLNLPDGYHKLDNESLNYIFSQFNPISSHSHWNEPKRAPLYCAIRHLIINNHDTLSYERYGPVYSGYINFEEYTGDGIGRFICEPYHDSINNTVYETKKIFRPKSTKGKNIIKLPNRIKRRKNFIFIKKGVFILAYNILPMNEKLFKTMIEQTFQIHSGYQRTRYLKNLLESDLNCRMTNFGYYKITPPD